MVGIPMDRVGCGCAEMWLLPYREWKWVLVGLHFASGVGYTSRACSLQLPNFSPEQWAWCAVPTAYFFGGSVFPTVSGNWATL